MGDVEIVGHSFVKRLVSYTAQPQFANLNMDPNNHTVTIESTYSKGKIVFVEHLERYLYENKDRISKAACVMWDISSNDICERYRGHPVELADRVHTLALLVRTWGAKTVGIWECLWRHGDACLPRDRRLAGNASLSEIHSAEVDYNCWVDDYNTKMWALCLEDEEFGLEFLKYEGLRGGFPDNLPDGIHIHPSLVPKYYTNMRRQAIRMCRKAR